MYFVINYFKEAVKIMKKVNFLVENLIVFLDVKKIMSRLELIIFLSM
jgi:hypothetical protein